MCGLVGVAGDLEFKDEATMKRLLVLDFFRGPDSTGFCSVKKTTGVPTVVKIASHPLDLFDTKRFDKALNAFGSKVFIGHNRFATKGKVNEVNAHPFQCGHITGVHNGTLDRASWKRLEEVIGYETDVDSLAIIESIAKIGIEDTVALLEEGRTSTDGAWALVWYDSDKDTLNFLRNKHRPLWYAWSEDFKKIFWASEWPMIDAATRMSGPQHSYKLHHSEEGYRFWECKHDWWYRIDLEELMNGSSAKPKIRVKEVKGREPSPVASYAGGSNFPQRNGNTTHYHGKTSTTVPDLLDFVGSKAQPLGGIIDQTRFDEIAKYGCSWCQADVSFFEPGVTIYEADDMVLCPKCSGRTDQSRVFVDPYDMSSYIQEMAARTGTK